MSKRLRLDDNDNPTAAQSPGLQTLSRASIFNRNTLQKLQKAMELNAEVDLTSVLPFNYAERLARMKNENESQVLISVPSVKPKPKRMEKDKFNSIRLPTNPAKIVYPLSDSVKNMFSSNGQVVLVIPTLIYRKLLPKF
ncbi:MAG: hypothetical protein M1834_003343 [Cirrosporium novae-zelandiae]|nr:MAG: hypothetical protein M1834_003343 [Cirrosporium novae-zelandiae]